MYYFTYNWHNTLTKYVPSFIAFEFESVNVADDTTLIQLRNMLHFT
jgi:hypothetical protein